MGLAFLLVLLSVVFSIPARAQTETVLYSFGSRPTDGYYPAGALVVDSSGNLFGTTAEGSNTLCDLAEVYGCGIVYELVKSSNGYTEEVLYTFGSSSSTSDGASPQAGLIMDAAGNLFGTTTYGGSSNCLVDIGVDGCGTVFELVKSSTGYTENVLYAFTGFDGAYPLAGLLMDSSGNLYGTTSGGGAYGAGEVFELVNSSGSYTEKVLYNFGASVADGQSPVAGVLMDAAGNLFGTTNSGGVPVSCGLSPCGTVFELVNSPSGYAEKVLYMFTGSDGASPEAGLIMDSLGNLYGTTSNGGGYGFGTIFELVNSSGSYTEKVLHSFGGSPTDGAIPTVSLLIDASGDLFGTTTMGGCATACGGYGSGTVFELVNSSGTYAEKVLHGFGGVSDGEIPGSALVMDSAGILYGTTKAGGYSLSLGTVFEVNPSASAPAVTLSASSLTFAQIVNTPSSPQTITIENSGIANLIFGADSVTLSGTNNLQFAISADTCTGITVLPKATCSVTVTFFPTVTATVTADVTFSDNAVYGAQTVTLTGTGLTPTASVTLSPASLSFSSQTVSTTSAAQNVTLMNSGGTPLSITGISTSAGFNETNNCGSSLAAAATCAIQVSFAPTAGGPLSGTLSVADNAGGSPQTIPIFGIGADFTIGLAPSSPQSVSISPGTTASYSLTVTPQGGFSQTVTLVCGGAPALAACSVSPSMAPLDGTDSIPLMVSVATTAPALTIPHAPISPIAPGAAPLVALFGLLGLLILWLAVRRGMAYSGRLGRLALSAIILLTAFWTFSCGSPGIPGSGSPGTPPGTYTLTVTGTAGALSNLTTLTINIK
jgi:uncharacterized repeat protein (TIGR03803 family)